MSDQRGTRERILEAAAELFAAHGYRGVSMEQLAERCAISKPALYYHFADKQTLFVEMVRRSLAEHRQGIEAAAAGRPLAAALQAIVRYLVDAVPHDVSRLLHDIETELDPAVRAELAALHRRAMVEPISHVLHAARRRGELRPDLDPLLAAWAFLGMLMPLFRGRQQPEARPHPELIELLIDLFIHGAAPR